MTDLSSEARALLAAGRRAHDPSPDAARRAWMGIQKRIALGAVAASVTVARPAAGAGGTSASASTGAGVVAAVGGPAKLILLGAIASGALTGLVLWPSGQGPAPARLAPPAITEAAIAEPPPAIDPPEAPAATPPAPRRIRGPVEPTLAAEMRLLAAAQNALRRGDAGRGLALARRHEVRFPRGTLVEERKATQVTALCRLGRIAEAHRLADRLEREHTGSPLAAGAAIECEKPPAQPASFPATPASVRHPGGEP